MSLTDVARKWLPRRMKEAAKKEIAQRFELPSMEWSLGNMRRLGFRPAGAVDIRAYKGVRLKAKGEFKAAPACRNVQPRFLNQGALAAQVAASLAGNFGNL